VAILPQHVALLDKSYQFKVPSKHIVISKQYLASNAMIIHSNIKIIVRLPAVKPPGAQQLHQSLGAQQLHLFSR
jgi:hypothetical protein